KVGLIDAAGGRQGKARSRAAARIREYDVEPSVPGGGALDCIAQRVRVRDVQRLRLDVASRGLQPRVDGLKSGRVDVGEHDLRAVFGHHLGIGEAKPARGAGNEGD